MVEIREEPGLALERGGERGGREQAAAEGLDEYQPAELHLFGAVQIGDWTRADLGDDAVAVEGRLVAGWLCRGHPLGLAARLYSGRANPPATLGGPEGPGSVP